MRGLGRHVGVLTGSDSFILEAMLMGCHGSMVALTATAVAEQVAMCDAVAARRIDDTFAT